MLSKKQLKEYRELRGLSYRDVANYCDISHVMIHHIECGERDLTEHAYKEIIKGMSYADRDIVLSHGVRYIGIKGFLLLISPKTDYHCHFEIKR